MTASTSRWRILGPLLVACYALWLCVGIFPISPVEGDEQGVINGATAMARGEVAYLELAYLPAIQPGAYALLATASRWTGASVENLFAAGTVIGAALFAAVSSKILAQILDVPVWVALGGLLLSQEISAAAFYLNTTSLGMWLTFVALWLALRTPDWRSCAAMALCIAIAGWIRVDCLLPTPAIPVLLYHATRNRRATLLATGGVALAAVALTLGFYAASGFGPHELVTTYAGRGAIDGWWPTVRAMPLLLSPLLCVALAAGLALLVAKREWWLLALIAAGCAVTLPIYGTSLASTKYFYHLVPFLLVPVLYLGRSAWNTVSVARPRWRPAGGVVAAALIAADQLIALQTSAPEFRRLDAEPVVARLATLHGRSRPITCVIGAGEPVPTMDGFRLRGGGFFAPLTWRREKTAMRQQLASFGELLRQTPVATVYYSGWLPYQMIVRVLRENGYVFTSGQLATNTMPYAGNWSAQGRRVRIDYLAYRTSNYFDPARHPENPTGQNTFFLGDLSGNHPITELADNGHWAPLWPEHRWRFVTFHQRLNAAPKS